MIVSRSLNTGSIGVDNYKFDKVYDFKYYAFISIVRTICM